MISKDLIRSARIVVVDDASDDGSFELLQQFHQENKLELIRLNRNRGYGFALKTGFSAAKSELVCFLDLDGSYDPADIELLIRELKEKRVDIVQGDRLSQPDVGMSLTRRVGNLGYTLLIRRLFNKPVRDVCTGMRVFRSQLTPWLTSLSEDQLNYSLSMTLSSIRHGLIVREIPIQYHPRLGRSKLSVAWDGVRFLSTILFAAYGPEKSLSLSATPAPSVSRDLN